MPTSSSGQTALIIDIVKIHTCLHQGPDMTKAHLSHDVYSLVFFCLHFCLHSVCITATPAAISFSKLYVLYLAHVLSNARSMQQEKLLTMGETSST